MSELRFTLVSDGSSDTMLLPVLGWLLEQHSERVFIGRWAELRVLRTPPRTLEDRVRLALDLFPCDLLFVHRDAERAPRADRLREIEQALSGQFRPPTVPVVPVRMQEAWFLFEASAIREAAGNPRGRATLTLPSATRVESCPSPKQVLEDALRKASELRGRRLERVRLGPMKHRLASLIRDFGALRHLSAFSALETDVARVLAEHGWT